MVHIFKRFFELCDVAFYLFVIGLLIGIFVIIKYRLKGKDALDCFFFWSIPREENRSKLSIWGARLIDVMAILSILNFFVSLNFKDSYTTVGAFYEKYSYTEEYEAIFHLNEDIEMLCTATLERVNGEGYFIRAVTLPTLGTFYNDLGSDDNIDPYKIANVSVFDYDVGETDLLLIEPADETSIEKVQSQKLQDIFTDGQYCASVNSDVYHLVGCRYADAIAHKNIYYFDNQYFAYELFGLESCSECDDLM